MPENDEKLVCFVVLLGIFLTFCVCFSVVGYSTRFRKKEKEKEHTQNLAVSYVPSTKTILTTCFERGWVDLFPHLGKSSKSSAGWFWRGCNNVFLLFVCRRKKAELHCMLNRWGRSVATSSLRSRC